MIKPEKEGSDDMKLIIALEVCWKRFVEVTLEIGYR